MAVDPPHPGISVPQPAVETVQALDVAALTRRMKKGDEMAYRTFYNAYFDRLWRYLLVVSAGNEDAAREALQATLLRVVRHIKIFGDETIFWSWLTVLARSAHRDETRKRRRYFSFLERFAGHAQREPGAPVAGDADRELQALLSSQLILLPPDEQRLIEQKYLSQRSVRDLAGELQITEKAVESRLSRIRRKLKQAVLAGLDDETGH